MGGGALFRFARELAGPGEAPFGRRSTWAVRRSRFKAKIFCAAEMAVRENAKPEEYLQDRPRPKGFSYFIHF